MSDFVKILLGLVSAVVVAFASGVVIWRWQKRQESLLLREQRADQRREQQDAAKEENRRGAFRVLWDTAQEAELLMRSAVSDTDDEPMKAARLTLNRYALKAELYLDAETLAFLPIYLDALEDVVREHRRSATSEEKAQMSTSGPFVLLGIEATTFMEVRKKLLERCRQGAGTDLSDPEALSAPGHPMVRFLPWIDRGRSGGER